MRLGTYRRHERPKRLEAPRRKSPTHPIPDEPSFLPVLPMSFDPPAASKRLLGRRRGGWKLVMDTPEDRLAALGAPRTASNRREPPQPSAASQERCEEPCREQLTLAKQRALICRRRHGQVLRRRGGLARRPRLKPLTKGAFILQRPRKARIQSGDRRRARPGFASADRVDRRLRVTHCTGPQLSAASRRMTSE